MTNLTYTKPEDLELQNTNGNLNNNLGLKIFSKLPPEVLKIFEIFGEKARLVGGSVRDLIIDKKVQDFDFACTLEPKQIQNILQKNQIKSIPTGIKYGTITAIIGNYNFQITTLRLDNNHQGRACAVSFTDDFFADAKRRDFTINAIYLDSQGKIYDYFSGINDLLEQKVRFIGDPKMRIAEDFLRILRFFRFSCYYAKELDREGLLNAILYKESLKIISKERIRQEFYKILACPSALNLTKFLKIFCENKFDYILWNDLIDHESLALALPLLKYSKEEHKNNIKIAIVFLKKDFDIKKFLQNFKGTNLEKNFLKKCQNYLEIQVQNAQNAVTQNVITQNVIALTDINSLLIFESKDFVINFCIIFFAKNYLTISQNYQAQQGLIEKNLANIIDYIIKLEIPEFIIKISDLKDISCPQNKLNSTYKKLKILWAQSNFKMPFDTLLSRAKEIINLT